MDEETDKALQSTGFEVTAIRNYCKGSRGRKELLRFFETKYKSSLPHQKISTNVPENYCCMELKSKKYLGLELAQQLIFENGFFFYSKRLYGIDIKEAGGSLRNRKPPKSNEILQKDTEAKLPYCRFWKRNLTNSYFDTDIIRELLLHELK